MPCLCLRSIWVFCSSRLGSLPGITDCSLPTASFTLIYHACFILSWSPRWILPSVSRITVREFCAYQYVNDVTVITEYDDFTWKTSFVRPMQSEVVNALRRGDRQRASLILSNFHHTKEALTKEDFYYILEYCAEAPDPLVSLLLNACFFLFTTAWLWYSHFD